MIKTQRIFITFYTVMYYIIIICDGPFSVPYTCTCMYIHIWGREKMVVFKGYS